MYDFIVKEFESIKSYIRENKRKQQKNHNAYINKNPNKF